VKTRIVFWPAGALVLLLASCQSPDEEEAKQRVAAQSSVITPDGAIHLKAGQIQANGIQTTAAGEQSVVPAISVVGRVKAQPGHRSDVFSPFAGRLVGPAELPRMGTSVLQGQVVAEVEQQLTAAEQAQFNAQITQLESAATQARQEVDLHRLELDRAKELYDTGAIPRKQLETAEFNLRQSEERFQAAGAAKQKYEALMSQQPSGTRRIEVRAPISGTVVIADLALGQQIDPAKSLATIADLRTVWVEAAVHETELPSERNARRAQITTPAYPGRTYGGTLVTIGTVVDPQNRTVPVVYAVNNPDASLKLDMTAQIRIPSGPPAISIVIPATAVLYQEGRSSVYVETLPGVFQLRPVTAGDRLGNAIAVLSGLKAGEKVVSVGAAALQSETSKGQVAIEGDE